MYCVNLIIDGDFSNAILLDHDILRIFEEKSLKSLRKLKGDLVRTEATDTYYIENVKIERRLFLTPKSHMV